MPDNLVFVLDDDEFSLNVVRDMFKKRPAIEARYFSRLADMSADPDIIRADLFVLDIRLPGDVSGFEVPARLPIRCRFAAYLFVSGFTIEADQYQRAAGLPLFDFLAKPFSAVKFLHRVDLLLAAHVRIPPAVDDRILGQWSRGSILSIVLDARGRIRLCNRFAAEALGLTKPVEAIGRPWADFDPDGAGMFPDSMPAEAEGVIQSVDGSRARVKWIRTDFDDPIAGPMILIVGAYADARNQQSNRLRRVYRDILAKDRAVIRSIRPFSLPGSRG